MDQGLESESVHQGSELGLACQDLESELVVPDGVEDGVLVGEDIGEAQAIMEM